jgi:NusA-like KH domain protein
MSNMIDMQIMRYINLFERISRVSTTNCFVYNNTIIFAVPKRLVSQAIGKNAENVKKIFEILRKKARVIEERNIDQLDKFISDVIEPSSFNKIELKNGELTLSANRQNKAALIGRNRQREQELEDILKKFYNIQKLKIL